MHSKANVLESNIQWLSWPQFATALAGGLLAFGVLGLVKRK